jgi:hypothetical protein
MLLATSYAKNCKGSYNQGKELSHRVILFIFLSLDDL